ncbi:MAG: hypothetical protein FWG94_02900 [Oscillospiraceae bacterium]|nr:hypothetical protein [Oscillospiraceae bacterium]
MSFKVSKITGLPVYDSLPVAKVVTYPLEKRDYRPFAQNILCVSDDALHLRMWSFEVNPSPGSRLECVLYMFDEKPDTALAIVAVPKIEEGSDVLGCGLLKNGGELPAAPEITEKLQSIAIHPHNGEDLQGVYWGYAIDIPLKLLEEWGGKTLLSPGNKLYGNFYKICLDEPNIHMGCFYGADFSGNPYLPESCGAFEVVGY